MNPAYPAARAGWIRRTPAGRLCRPAQPLRQRRPALDVGAAGVVQHSPEAQACVSCRAPSWSSWSSWSKSRI